MPDNTQSTMLFSPKTVRVLHLTLTAFVIVSLALHAWSWTHSGRTDWTNFLAPLGYLMMGVGGLIDPALGRRCQALYFVAAGFIALDLIMRWPF